MYAIETNYSPEYLQQRIERERVETGVASAISAAGGRLEGEDIAQELAGKLDTAPNAIKNALVKLVETETGGFASRAAPDGIGSVVCAAYMHQQDIQ